MSKLNVPNQLSIIRIIMVPIMVFFYLADFIPWGKFIALIICIIAASTDFLDGYIARKYNLVTNLGKFLDSNADKILATTALILVLSDLTFATWITLALTIITVLVVARDIVLATIRQMAAASGTVVSADKWGKIKTAITMVALPMAMFIGFNNSEGVIKSSAFMNGFSYVTYALFIIFTFFTLLSMFNYIVKNAKFLKQ